MKGKLKTKVGVTVLRIYFHMKLIAVIFHSCANLFNKLLPISVYNLNQLDLWSL